MDQTVVRFEGEIDLGLSDELGAILRRLEGTARPVVLDVAQLTFCDLTFASFVVALSRPRRGPVPVVPANPRVIELLSLAGLRDTVTF